MATLSNWKRWKLIALVLGFGLIGLASTRAARALPVDPAGEVQYYWTILTITVEGPYDVHDVVFTGVLTGVFTNGEDGADFILLPENGIAFDLPKIAGVFSNPNPGFLAIDGSDISGVMALSGPVFCPGGSCPEPPLFPPHPHAIAVTVAGLNKTTVYELPNGGTLVIETSAWMGEVDEEGNISLISYGTATFTCDNGHTISKHYTFELALYAIDEGNPPVPEPTSGLLMGGGLLALAAAARRRAVRTSS